MRIRLPSSLFVLVLAGCGASQEHTTFPISITGVRPSGVSEMGWTVTLDTALFGVGPLRFFEGTVPLAVRLERWLYLPFGGTALAHPGHYVPGEALGELVEGRVIDLLAGPILLGDVSAVTGEYGSLQLDLTPLAAEADPDGLLEGHSLRVKGRATHTDGRVVDFEASGDLSKAIEAIRAQQTVVVPSRPVTITVDLGTWVQRIAFDTAAAVEGAPSTFLPETQAYNALIRGASDNGGYVVTWAP